MEEDTSESRPLSSVAKGDGSSDGKENDTLVKAEEPAASLRNNSSPTPAAVVAATSPVQSDDATTSPTAPSQHIVIKIASAEYGPCEGRRLLLTGELTDDAPSTIPYSRDVTPFVRALLLAQQIQEEHAVKESNPVHNPQTPKTQEASSSSSQPTNRISTYDPTLVRLGDVDVESGMKRAHIVPPFLNEQGMNACFGDPCPGVSKRLHLSYMIATTNGGINHWAATAERHGTSFAEHEKVVLRRRRYPKDDTEANIVRGDAELSEASRHHVRPGKTKNESVKLSAISAVERFSRAWSLPTAVSEVVLPLVMEYLSIPERVHARIVCRGWRRIIRDFGVATVIDNNDPQLQPGLTRPFLMGLLQHSYSSLQSLFLSGFEDLEKDDLHLSIPHLRKLRSLDVSRCIELDDSTMELLAKHCADTLEVLYIKGLRRVTDRGMLALCDNCIHLRVLEISNIPLTDVSGAAIGRKLINLHAIYMRDNFRLTNESITSITNNCYKLEQLTLWGCTRIKEINFAPSCRQQLFLLNLWGCHGLNDDAAAALEGMHCLRTLIVSECHRLTDSFFITMAKWVPRLCHLYARYCKHMSDVGVDAIARNLENLYSLDLSFCTKVSPSSVRSLLEHRGGSLAELRLQSCRQLYIGNTRDFRRRNSGVQPGSAGQSIVEAMKLHGQSCCLSALDVRDCGGQPQKGKEYQSDDPFVQSLTQMTFQQRVPGYFNRPARWNPGVQMRLVEHLLGQTSRLS